MVCNSSHFSWHFSHFLRLLHRPFCASDSQEFPLPSKPSAFGAPFTSHPNFHQQADFQFVSELYFYIVSSKLRSLSRCFIALNRSSRTPCTSAVSVWSTSGFCMTVSETLLLQPSAEKARLVWATGATLPVHAEGIKCLKVCPRGRP